MRERKRKNFQKNYKSNLIIGRASISVVAIALTFMLGMLYLSQMNVFAVKGASISDLESRKSQLEEERDRLQIEATRLQSIQEIEKTLDDDSATKDKYVPVDKINYLPSSNVAVK
jgi:cell division protein FtsL